MEITCLPNGYVLEKFRFRRRIMPYIKRGSWIIVFGFIGGLLNGYLVFTTVLFGLIFFWHFMEWFNIYRYHLKSLIFLDDCVKVEYFDHNKPREFTAEYKDLSIIYTTLWYKTRNIQDHLVFTWKGERVFRQFCYDKINKAFLKDVANKYQAWRFDKVNAGRVNADTVNADTVNSNTAQS